MNEAGAGGGRRRKVAAGAVIAVVALAGVGWRLRPIDHADDALAEVPGRSHRKRVEDLPPPQTPLLSSRNDAVIVPRPPDALPRAPAGFRVRLYAHDLPAPRELKTAPNGDVFLTHMQPGEVLVLRGLDADGAAKERFTFATGLDAPFGVAFYPAGPAPEWLYVAETS